MSDLWYKRAIVYSVDVETFQDSNGDGIGDFPGLIDRLDYLKALGINCLWLLPFFPSPNRDNGYDVLDYYGVDSRLGTLGDFVELVHAADERGIRVMMDLVVNHTSREHPWFQAARRDPDSRYRDYYVWSEEKPEGSDEEVIFPGEQESIWSYDDEAGLYYLHRFYQHQPDLNVANPDVREEIKRIMGYWLQLGVAGFRVDAVPFLIEHKGIAAEKTEHKDPYEYLRDMRDFLSWRRGDAVLLAEANVAPDEVKHYFGNGDKLHLLFNFYLNQHLFLSLAEESAEPLVEAWRKVPPIPHSGQWANFLRNHDELDLGRLSDEQRQRVFEAFAPEPRMQLYDRGIRRRLAPMLGGDRVQLELAYSLMFSLPGTPVIWYGEEIGMGDDLSLDERNSVRTPMQWSSQEHGGFSTAPPSQHARPVISEGEWGFERINVADQRRDSDSMLNWMRRLIQARLQCPEFGHGACDLVETGDPAVIAHRCHWEDHAVIAVHNLASEPRTVSLQLPDDSGELIDLLDGRSFQQIRDGSCTLELGRHGYRWLRLGEA